MNTTCRVHALATNKKYYKLNFIEIIKRVLKQYKIFFIIYANFLFVYIVSCLYCICHLAFFSNSIIEIIITHIVIGLGSFWRRAVLAREQKSGTWARPKFIKIFSNFFNIIDYLLQKFQNFSSNISEVIVDRPRKIRHFSKNQHFWP